MHLDDPDDERLERLSYATLCLFLFGSIYWLPYLLR
jgi:hypothetical protein